MSDVLKVTHQWWVEEARADLYTRVFGITAGLGSGKTHGMCQFHHDRCILNQKSKKSGIMTVTYQKIHDAIIPTYEKVLNGYGLQRERDYRIIKSPFPKLIYKAYEHEVHFLTAERTNTLVASEYSHGAVSEVGSCPKEAIDLFRTRIRCNLAQVRQYMLEGVTQGMNFYADMFDSDGPGWKLRAERDYINRDKLFRRFRVTSYDNPYLPDDYIPTLLDIYSGRPAYIEAWILGKFTALIEGTVYCEYSPAVHDYHEEVDASPELTLDVTFDFNNNPVTWIAMQDFWIENWEERKRVSFCLDESSESPSTIRAAIDEFTRKFPVEKFGRTQIRIFGDSSGHAKSHRYDQSEFTDYMYIVEELNKRGYRYVEVHAIRYNPSELETIEAVNAAFRNNALWVSPACKNLRRSLLVTQFKEGTRKIDKPAGETWTHPGDALKYRMYVDTVGTKQSFQTHTVK